MTIISVQIERSYLRAAVVLAAVNDIRSYLNGVFVETFPERSFIVATDGRRMAVLRDDSPEARLPAGSEPVRFIVPRELLDKIKANNSEPKVGITFDTVSQAITIKDGITQSTKTASDGTYPDYRRAFPDKLSGVPEQIGSESAADFAKIARILGCRSSCSVLVFHNGPTAPTEVGGSNVVEIEGHPEFLGLIIGTRDVRRAPIIDRVKFLARTVEEEQAACQGDEAQAASPAPSPAQHALEAA